MRHSLKHQIETQDFELVLAKNGFDFVLERVYTQIPKKEKIFG
jgi:hypothetical protein